MNRSCWDPVAKCWATVAPGEQRPHARERYRNHVTCAGWFGRLRLGERATFAAAIDGADDALTIPGLSKLAAASGLAPDVLRRNRAALMARGLIVPAGKPGQFRLAIPSEAAAQ